MIADIILKLLGNNPAEFYPEDKWSVIIVDLSFIVIPIFLVFLLIAPFLFLWIRKKQFSLKNIIISLFVSLALVALALFGLWLILWYLQGRLFMGIYGGI